MSKHVALDCAEHTAWLLESALNDAERYRRWPLEDLEARVGWFEDFLDEDDKTAWKTLLDPGSPAWLGRRDDLHHLEVRSIYLGRKPKRQ